MAKIPLVSIALCVYNGEKYIHEQLDSILNQSYENLEIIIVDDASTDETYPILEKYGQKYPGIKLYRNAVNQGFTKNFELAIDYCQGEYIAWSDQDDIWLPNKIKLQVENIGANELIYHDSLLIDENGNSLNRKISDLKNFYKGSNPKIFLFDNCISGHSILMTRRLAKIGTPIPEGVFHDWWMAYLATNIGSVTFLDACLVLYRQHHHAITSEKLESKSFKMQDEKNRLLLFRDHFSCSIEPFITKIIGLMDAYKNGEYSPGLSWLIVANLNSLMFIRKKPLTSKILKSLKFSYRKNQSF